MSFSDKKKPLRTVDTKEKHSYAFQSRNVLYLRLMNRNLPVWCYLFSAQCNYRGVSGYSEDREVGLKLLLKYFHSGFLFLFLIRAPSDVTLRYPRHVPLTNRIVKS